jgi:transposase-like protein
MPAVSIYLGGWTRLRFLFVAASHYLYRAVDRHGKTVDSLLCTDRSEAAARALFNKALETHQPKRPRKVNLGGNAASHRALRLLREESPELRSVVIRSRRYLNNIIEQDHRAIKRRCAPMLGLKSFRTGAVTLAGVELAHRIRKRQFSFGRGRRPRRFSSLKQLWALALARHDLALDRNVPSVAKINHHCTRTQALAC